MPDLRAWVVRFTVLALVVGAACSSPTDSATSESILIVVDSIPTNSVGGVRLTPPSGAATYSQVGAGSNTLVSSVPLGLYEIAFDTVGLRDTGTYDGSRWIATPISLRVQLDGRKSVDTIHVAYRKITGGISVSATGNDVLWVEFLYPDGSGCRCTAGGGAGLRVPSSGGSVQNLLPGEYQVHFLPITDFISPHTPPPYITHVPSPSVVTVTVRVGELAHASAVYTNQ